MAGALVVHVAIIALLILVGFTPPEPSEEGGVPVMLGEVPDALGAADPSLVKVDVMPEETAPQVQETVEQDIITQETEETVAIKPKAEPKKKEEEETGKDGSRKSGRGPQTGSGKSRTGT